MRYDFHPEKLCDLHRCNSLPLSMPTPRWAVFFPFFERSCGCNEQWNLHSTYSNAFFLLFVSQNIAHTLLEQRKRKIRNVLESSYTAGISSGKSNPQLSRISESLKRLFSGMLCSTTPIRWWPLRVAEKIRQPPASSV